MSYTGYNPPAFGPVTPAVPLYGIGSGPGIGRLAIGSVPIPSLFAETQAEITAESGIGGFRIGAGQIGGGDAKMTPFTKIIKRIRADRLMRIAGALGKTPLSDEYIRDQLLAAERMVERELRVFLVPREIIPVGTPMSEVQALAAQGCPMVEEPGYPYDTNLFQGMDLETRNRPIINIYRLWYTYQGEGTPIGDATQVLYDIPQDWIQVDRKYGCINLLPSSTFTNLPLNSWLLSVLGSGRDIPFGLKLRYSAGLSDALNEYPDLVQLILRRTVISVMDDAFLPQSGSISIDGMSQSLSRDVDKYREATEKSLARIAEAIRGIRMVVL